MIQPTAIALGGLTATSSEKFSEKEEIWFCALCGIVDGREVVETDEEGETAFCRCGSQITKTVI